MGITCECQIIEARPNQWFYLLERHPGEVTEKSWVAEAICVGPFAEESFAGIHLLDNHANPGGWRTCDHARFWANDMHKDRVLQATLARATPAPVDVGPRP